ncbi:unnamed protein product [Darwinula stevensoni]|uniref:TFIIS N-terminal domain-containing protein n=1 Tax=Darwinula stevensoni TaxID=69355 RepID=A0A7R8XA88_9CRUS|nr:unnamed protein product [Darwinula stevensoni]CAG0885318.1 unnamed protein product [Darwinula stevensoni]
MTSLGIQMKRLKTKKQQRFLNNSFFKIISGMFGKMKQLDLDQEEEEKEKEKEKEEEEEKEKTEGGEAEGGSEEKKEILPELTDSSSDEGPNDREQMGDFASDFDMMMQRKKLERGYRRRRKNVDIISDSDDLIADLMVDMRNAAEEDRELNLKGEPAIKKLSVMKRAQNELLKADLQHAFLDSGILNVFTEWLSPMPDRSLPSLKIRTAFLKILQQFPRVESHALKASGIGKAIMYLYKHPKETKENRMRAGKLINEWSRPIFNLATNFSAMSKEEREQRDFEQLNKAKRISNDGGSTPARRESTSESEDTPRRPGDPGWVYRARVPQPSTKAYVVRPKWKSDIDISKSTKKGMSHLEKQLQELKRNRKKQQRAVKISIEGNRMAL